MTAGLDDTYRQGLQGRLADNRAESVATSWFNRLISSCAFASTDSHVSQSRVGADNCGPKNIWPALRTTTVLLGTSALASATIKAVAGLK